MARVRSGVLEIYLLLVKEYFYRLLIGFSFCLNSFFEAESFVC